MKHLMPVLVALLLTIGVFHRFFFFGEIPMPGNFMVSFYEPWKSENTINGVPTIPHKPIGDDIFRQIYPQKYLAIQQLKEGLLPLWNPFNGAGQPLLATLHSGFLNPFSLLLLGGVVGWAWYIIIQFPLLFLSTYWYTRSIGLSKLASLISSSVLCFSGFVIGRTIYGDYIYALITLPLLLSGIELLVKKQVQGSAMVVPFSAWFLLVSVQPQISVYICATVFLYACIRLWKHISIIRGVRVSTLLLYTVFVLIGLGLSSIQLLPTFELYSLANVTQISSLFIFEKFLVPFSHLFTVLIPNFFGNPGTYNFWGYTDYIETLASVGTVPILFSVIAVWFLFKDTIVKFFTVMTLLTLLVSFTSPLTSLLYNLPLPIISTSIPTRIYILTTFSIAILTGFGIQHILEIIHSNQIKKILFIWLSFLLLVLLLVGLFIFNISCVNQVNCMNVAIRNLILEYTFVSLFILCSVISYYFFPNKKIYIALSCLLVVICSGIYNANKFLPFSTKQHIMPSHQIMTQLKQLSPVRVKGEKEAQFSTDFATYYGWYDSNYYDPLYIRRYGELFSYAHTENKERGLSRSDIIMDSYTENQDIIDRLDRLSQLVSIGYVVKKSSGLNTQTVWNDETWTITDFASRLPRAYLSSNVVTKTEDELLAYVFSNSFDPHKTAVVEEYIEFVNSDKNIIPVDVDEYSSQNIVVNTNLQEHNFLVLTDTYYPGWRAYINGKETKIYRTNYAFRGILVPKGSNRIEFIYRPLSLYLGILLSAFTLSIWILLVIRLRDKN